MLPKTQEGCSGKDSLAAPGTATGIHQKVSLAALSRMLAETQPVPAKQTKQKERRWKEGRSAIRSECWPTPRKLPSELAGLGPGIQSLRTSVISASRFLFITFVKSYQGSHTLQKDLLIPDRSKKSLKIVVKPTVSVAWCLFPNQSTNSHLSSDLPFTFVFHAFDILTINTSSLMIFRLWLCTGS